MTTEYTIQQLQLREQLADSLTRDSLEQSGVKIGKDLTSDDALMIKGGTSTDQLKLQAIDRVIGDTNVRAVFVYRTSQDSDAGAWRKRTSHTSWYNETLNTNTRGTRREFPSVAVIVAHQNKLVIHDGDDPMLPMWMVFHAESGNMIGKSGYASTSLTCVHMLNGVLAVGSGLAHVDDRGNFSRICFVTDGALLGYSGNYGGNYLGSISERNMARGKDDRSYDGWDNFWHGVRDIDMVVTNQDELDPDTGLPAPTIAVSVGSPDGTNDHFGCMALIKADKTCANWGVDNFGWIVKARFAKHAQSSGNTGYGMVITGGGGLRYHGWWLNELPINGGNSYAGRMGHTNDSKDWTLDTSIIPREPNGGNGTLGTTMCVHDDTNRVWWYDEAPGTSQTTNKLVGVTTDQPYFSNNMRVFINSQYNTGWLYGQVKHAALNTLDTNDVGTSRESLIKYERFSTPATTQEMPVKYPAWKQHNAEISVSNGALVVDDTLNQGAHSCAHITIDTEPGVAYMLSYKKTSATIQDFVAVHSDVSGLGGEGDIYHVDGSGEFNTHVFHAKTWKTTLAFGTHDNGVATFDGISVQRSSELIANGGFDGTQYGPQTWNPYPVAGHEATQVWHGSTLELREAGTSDYAIITQQVKLEAGKQYRVRARYRCIDGVGEAGFYIGATREGGNDNIVDYNTGKTSSNDWITRSVAFTSTTNQIVAVNLFARYTGAKGEFDYLSIVEIEKPGKCDYNTGEMHYGEVQKTPVAPGASLQCYTNLGQLFGGTSNGRSYYRSRIEGPTGYGIDGTNDFMISIWYYLVPDGAPHGIIGYGGELNNNGFLIYSGSYNSTIHGDRYFVDVGYLGTTDSFGGNVLAESSLPPLKINAWNHIVVTKTDDTFTTWVNGRKHPTTWGASGVDWSTRWTGGTGTDKEREGARWVVGDRAGTMLDIQPANQHAKFALWKISSSDDAGCVPSDAQIKRMYEDERLLFLPGARTGFHDGIFPHTYNSDVTGNAYGDVISCGCYDKHTQTLHVGTGDARNSFHRGILIDHTNYPTNLIHATGGIIAEQ